MLSNLAGLQKFQKLIRNQGHEEPHKWKHRRATPRMSKESGRQPPILLPHERAIFRNDPAV
jgi:hypothetical protein